MNDLKNISKKSNSSKSIRLAARIIGTIWLSIGLFFVIGSIFEQRPKDTEATFKPPDILMLATLCNPDLRSCCIWRTDNRLVERRIGRFYFTFWIHRCRCISYNRPGIEF